MKPILFSLLFFPVIVGAQNIKTIAGNGTGGFSGDNAPATTAELHQPGYICIDNFENILISDFQNNAIRKVNTLGIITTIAGTGKAGYSGDNDFATAAQLSGPMGIVCDNTGYIYVAEYRNNTIRKISPAGIITTIAGTGIPGYTGDNGPATKATLHTPYGIAIDNFGNIYFTDDLNYCVRKINSSGIITTIAGNGTFGYSGDNGPATAAQFKYLGSIAIDNSGNIYIADYMNHCTRKVNTSGTITTFAGTGTLGNTGDDGPATAAELNGPNGVHVDNDGNVYIIDNYANVVRKINPAGIIINIAGNGTSGYSGDNGIATAAQLSDPNDIAINASNNIYVTDVDNNVIRKITYNKEATNNINTNIPSITIHPNPSHNIVIIAAQPHLMQAREITFCNAFGQVVYKGHYSDKEINISTLPKGTYFVKVDGIYVGRFVKE